MLSGAQLTNLWNYFFGLILALRNIFHIRRRKRLSRLHVLVGARRKLKAAAAALATLNSGGEKLPYIENLDLITVTVDHTYELAAG